REERPLGAPRVGGWGGRAGLVPGPRTNLPPAGPGGIGLVERGGARPADMQEARRGGSKARDDGFGHVGWFLQRSAFAGTSAGRDRSTRARRGVQGAGGRSTAPM